MNGATADDRYGTQRPPCYHCGEPYPPVNAVRHTEPVGCVCARCNAMPACYTCRNMYCACAAHQH
jgi:hypothetical protein